MFENYSTIILNYLDARKCQLSQARYATNDKFYKRPKLSITHKQSNLRLEVLEENEELFTCGVYF